MKRKYKNNDLNGGELVEVEPCPRCDKQVVKVRNYTNGDQLFIHRESVRSKPFPHIMIEESCYVKAKDR